MRTIKVTIDGVEYTLHAMNASIFMYSEEKYNHLFVTEEELSLYMFCTNATLQKIAEFQAVQMHFLPLRPPDIDIRAHGMLEHGRGVVYVTGIGTDNPTMRAVNFKPDQPKPLTEEEVNFYAQEFRDGINWYELE